MINSCGNCGGPKPDNYYQACPECREKLRRTKMKGDYPEIDTLRQMKKASENNQVMLSAYVQALERAFLNKHHILSCAAAAAAGYHDPKKITRI